MESAKAKFHQGLAEFKKDNYGEAFSLFTDATRYDPEFSDAFYHLGIIYQHQDDFELSTRYFAMAIQANPNHFGARAQLGLLVESDSESTVFTSAENYSESDFFVRLGEDQREATDNLIEAIETSELAPKLDMRDVVVDRFLRTGARFLILLLPALIAAFIIAATSDAMGFVSFLPVLLVSTGLFFFLRILFSETA